MKNYVFLFGLILFISLTSCATLQKQYNEDWNNLPEAQEKEVEKTFYLIGGAGETKEGSGSEVLEAFNKYTQNKDTSDDYLLFLGDQLYDEELSKQVIGKSEVSDLLENKLDFSKQFEGRTIFLPGDEEWYKGISGLKNQEKLIDKELGKNSFLPEKGCPLEVVDVSDNIVLITIDTQWYLTDWDKHPTINDQCEIRTRNDFLLELAGELKKNNEKTILLAMHHPAYTYGPHGGSFGADKHLYPMDNKVPMPIFASIAAQVRAQGGISPQDRSNNRYNELMNRLITLAKGSDRLIFASGHEQSLQYINAQGVKQIVSGSGSKNSSVKLGKFADFVYGNKGFAVLEIFTDGSSVANFYASNGKTPELIFSTEVHKPRLEYDIVPLADSFEPTRKATAYSKEATNKGSGYEGFWGDHYRYVYGTDIEVPVATLDTLYGGFKVDRKGGGNQTRSLRLKDKNGRNFALRGVKKSATQYLQKVLFPDNYVEDDFKETVTEDLILDFYTASHPYASFVVGPMSDAIGVYHTNPKLIYMPKHKALGQYNSEFGNELYVIEERPDSDFLDIPSFGNPDAIESTSDVMKNIRKDEEYRVDEAAFIKARLFDMILGDWDRHQDQWRWSRFDISKDEKIYKPIPRDRDQVFSYYDGTLLDIARVLIPSARQLQKFGPEVKDIKWLNAAGIKLDRTFIQEAPKERWLEQARFIQENLTNEVIENSFKSLPIEVQDATSEEIKSKLKSRRDDILTMADRYYDYLSKLIIITGTDKDDHFEITRSNGSTHIAISRIKDGEIKKPYKERTVYSNETKEVWIYGLDDDDQFVVKGEGANPVFIRIIGGQNNDVYDFENGSQVKVHDHESKPNTIVNRGGASFVFNDDYEINNYNYSKLIIKQNSIVPSIGFNPDDGLKVGLTDTYTVKGFKTNPFHQKHMVRMGYYFATQGFDVEYTGEFANTLGKWNLWVNAHATSENFTRNFFGFGNETEFPDEDDLDFNRVKTGILSGRFGLMKLGEYGSRIGVSAALEVIEVDNTPNRFTTIFFEDNQATFNSKNFINLEADYGYQSVDNGANPTRGAIFKLKGGFRFNGSETDRSYGYIHPGFQFYNSLTNDKKLVLKTMAEGQFNIGNNFEFYQAAVVGAGNGLRGYRTQRFSGNSALAVGADLRYSFRKFKTVVVPLQWGIYGGYDTGRVWQRDEDSNVWHSNVGGGVWINAVDTLSGQFGLFSGSDGIRVAFGFGFSL